MEKDLEGLIAKVVEEVLHKEQLHGSDLPRARLLGREPERNLGYTYVRQGAYEAVVIGSMSGWELLQFPNEVCTEALMKGKPILLCEDGLVYRKDKDTCNRALYGRLLAAERELRQLGVRFIGKEEKKLLTARDVRRLLESGQPITGRLTPLARDILEAESKRIT